MATSAPAKTAPQARRRLWQRWLRYLVLLAVAVLIVYLRFPNDLAATQRALASISSKIPHLP